MNIKTSLHLVVGLVVGITASGSSRATDLAIADEPLFLSTVPPNIMVMLDNSGSMKWQLYKSDNPYNNDLNYYGIFDYDKNYKYDSDIPVNTEGYTKHAPSLKIDTTKTGAFVESSTCTLGSGNNCWSGRFLNWITSKRIDASRRVLVGGKLESDTEFTYGGGLKYKIVSNNEKDDRLFSEAADDSASYSPIPNNQTVTVSSPANDNGGNIQAAYDPYAKLYAGGKETFIYNSANEEKGEFGSVTVNKDGGWKKVNFVGTYVSAPIVVAQPPSYSDSGPGIVRIKDVTSTYFRIRFDEWNHYDGTHDPETIKYIVLTEGHHTLPGGLNVQAGKESNVDDIYNSGDCGSAKSDSTSIGFLPSMDDPIVIASVMTHKGSAPVSIRVWDVSDSGFKVAMQEEEGADNTHNPEEISWIAFNQGTVNDTSNLPNWKLESKLITGIGDEEETTTFDTTTFDSPPHVLAGLQTVNENDAAALRLTNVSKTDFTTFIEEEESCDTEVDHADESVGYVALHAGGEYNVALVVKDKPTGLLHDIKDQVRLGVSFYRFDPEISNIYNGNKIQGGTLKFKIPKNPYVKNPTNTNLPGDEQGYRELAGYIGTDIDDVVDAINNYPLVWGTTPLAENLWEVIQYFEQDKNGPHYGPVVAGFEDFDLADDVNHPEWDPYYYPTYGRKLECAKSSVIIFTDGAPYRDADVPDEVVNYDGDDPKPAGDVNSIDPNEHGKDNLDDVAKWAYCNTANTKDECSRDAGGTRDLRTDIANMTDVNGRVIGQFLKSYTVGFSGDTLAQILADTAENGGGKSYIASDGITLKAALTDAFNAAISDSSASSVAVTTGSISSTSTVFQARFNSNDWSGELLAYPINSDGSLGTTAHDAGKILGESAKTAAVLRKIITYNGAKGVPFQWPADKTGLGASAIAALVVNEISTSQASSLVSEDVLDHLRGDQSKEEQNGGAYRDRDSLLGDIVNASPAYVGASSVFSYPDSLQTPTHSAFKVKLNKTPRTPAVYVGANDGMLHAFNAEVTDTDNDGVPEFPTAFGNELFAYVPGFLYGKLKTLTSPDYAHQYTADGAPTVGDAFFGKAWHTVLVAGANAGGQGIYALDITNTTTTVASESAAAAKVLWEFTDVDDNGVQTDGNIGEKGDLDLGYTFSKPNIVRMANGKWAAVFGNGYNNTKADGNVSISGNAVLYIVDIETGELIRKIDTGKGTSVSYSGGKPNGLATVAPVDIDGDSIVDFIYGGDLYGHLWKFDVRDKLDPTKWVVAYSGAPLFSACAAAICTDDNRQPITVRPQVGFKTGNVGYMVYFGTGKYIETTIDTSAGGQTTQSFYGIWDKNETTLTAFNRSNLLQQKILAEVTITKPDYDLRVSSNYTMTNELGWYMDLVNLDSKVTYNNQGERQVSDPILRNGRIIFTTLIPSADPCEAGGSGWLMELDAQLGARLPYTPFDLNGDGVYDINDYVDSGLKDKDGNPIMVPASGKKSKVGIINTPGVVGDKEKEYKYSSGSTGDIEVTSENPGLEYVGRQSWNRLDQ